jgi:Uma2 family endonuclease
VRFSAAQFQAMIAAGILEEGARVELIGGKVQDMAAGEGYRRADGAAFLAEALRAALGDGVSILMNTLLHVDADTELYPNILVVPPNTPSRARSPKTVSLIVEVSETTLARDRDVKGPRYAAAGFQEFWIYEPAHRRIWVHREPMEDGRWGLIFKREGDETIAPLCAPESALAIPIVPTDEENATA